MSMAVTWGSLLACALLASGAAASGCASLVPVRDVLAGMDDRDVDVILAKAAERYPQLSRLLISESFTIILDSIVVPGPHDRRAPDARPEAEPPAWREDEAALAGQIASYMLGDDIGREWVSRMRNERVGFGEGSTAILIYRSPDGRSNVMDAEGLFTLFIPRPAGVEALSFDLKVANQRLELAPDTKDIPIYAEVLPRNAAYTSQGLVWRRFFEATSQLGWTGAHDGRGAAGTPSRSSNLASFLGSSSPFIGPFVRIRIRLNHRPDGSFDIVRGYPNPIELVLPGALVTATPAMEASLERLARDLQGHVTRDGDVILARVGSFIFHPGSARPTGPNPSEWGEIADLKRFRIPPSKAPPR